MPTHLQQIKAEIDAALSKAKEVYEAEIDALQAKIEVLEAKSRLQLNAEENAELRKLAGRENISVEAWLEREIQIAVRYADAPMIRVQQVFYDRLKELAAARGTMPESLTLSTETTQRFMSLIENLLI